MDDWLPSDYRAPERLDLPTGHHLRQIREDDLDLDHPAVMRSRERLWSYYGAAWGWPPESLTREQDRVDLRRHALETTRNESFNYAVLHGDETRLLGCVYLDPPADDGADVDVLWWVVDEELGRPLDAVLARAVPKWVSAEWPFERPRFTGNAPPPTS